MPNQLSAQEVRERMNSNEPVVLIDVLGNESYEKKHVPEAMNIPVESPGFEERVRSEIPNKEVPVIVYCAGMDCQASPKAAKKLEELGYTNVSDFKAGLEGWEEAGLPFETKESQAITSLNNDVVTPSEQAPASFNEDAITPSEQAERQTGPANQPSHRRQRIYGRAETKREEEPAGNA